MAVTAYKSEEGADMPKPEEGEALAEQDDSALSELEAFFDDENADAPDETTEEQTESEEVEEDTEEVEEKEAEVESEETEEVEVKEESEVQEQTQEDAQEQEEENTDSGEQEVEEKTQQQLAHEAFKRREAERKLREAEQKREEENLERYLNEAKDDEVELAKRQLEVNAYILNKNRSEVLQEKLDVSMQKAVLDLGLKNMDDATKEFVGRRLDEFEATRVIKDQRGNIVEVRGDVYQYLKEEMDSIQAFRSSGAREQTKRKAQEKVAVIPKPTRTPKEKPTDDGLDAFAEEANKW